MKLSSLQQHKKILTSILAIVCIISILSAPIYSAQIIKSSLTYRNTNSKPCVQSSWDEFSKIRTRWVDFWGGNRHEMDSKIAVDHQNNYIYVTVNSLSFADFMRSFLLKYNHRGRQLWNIKISDKHSKAKDICINNGFIYVTGLLYRTEENIDVFVAKYDTNGEQIWFKKWDKSEVDIGDTIVCNNDDVYVGGRMLDNEQSSQDVLLLHYLDRGTTCQLVKYKTWGGEKDDIIRDMAFSNNNLYLCGTTMGDPAGGSHDAVLLYFDTSDPVSNIKLFNIWREKDYDQLEGVVVRDNYLMVVGWSKSFSHKYDIVILKYNLADHELVWEKIWGKKDCNLAYGITYGDNYFYLTGEMIERGAVSEEKATLVIKFDSDGTIKWSKIWGKSYFAAGEDIQFFDGNLHVVGAGSPIGEGYLDAFLFTCNKEGKKALTKSVFSFVFQDLQALFHNLFWNTN